MGIDSGLKRLQSLSFASLHMSFFIRSSSSTQYLTLAELEEFDEDDVSVHCTHGIPLHPWTAQKSSLVVMSSVGGIIYVSSKCLVDESSMHDCGAQDET